MPAAIAAVAREQNAFHEPLLAYLKSLSAN